VFLARVRATLEEHLSDDTFGVEELALAIDQSRSTLYRRLLQLVNQTPTTFVRQVRLERAAVLLEERRGTISEVAYAVGFKSVSHFSYAFRAAYGVTPTAYVDRALAPLSC
jgi:AraC-like DNA-binding protein